MSSRYSANINLTGLSTVFAGTLLLFSMVHLVALPGGSTLLYRIYTHYVLLDPSTQQSVRKTGGRYSGPFCGRRTSFWVCAHCLEVLKNGNLFFQELDDGGVWGYIVVTQS